MQDKIVPLLKKARLFLAKYGLQGVNWEKLNKEGISMKEMVENFKTPKELVNYILLHERESFEQIFNENDYDVWNAIDILLLISKDINDKFFYINPTITVELKDLFPDIYEAHVQQREEFIREKVITNIEKGIEQNIYNKDINPTLFADEFRKELDDAYDKEALTSDNFSFQSIVEKLQKYYIRTVANKEGLNYYRDRKQLYAVLGFGQ